MRFSNLRCIHLSVELGLDIHGTSLNGAGSIHLDIAGTNNGNQTVRNGASSYAFWLVDQDGIYVPGFKQTGLQPQIIEIIQPGAGFAWSFNFTAPSVQVGPIYTLICYFQQTQDESTQTFTFGPAV